MEQESQSQPVIPSTLDKCKSELLELQKSDAITARQQDKELRAILEFVIQLVESEPCELDAFRELNRGELLGLLHAKNALESAGKNVENSETAQYILCDLTARTTQKYDEVLNISK
jgi:hypothetical protein